MRAPNRSCGFYERLVDRVRELPGVRTAGAARLLPLGSTIGDFGLMVEGYVPSPGTNAKGDWQIVTDGYLEAMGERLVRGRTIAPADTSDSQLVALVNEELARRYFAGRDPIGGRLKIGGRSEAAVGHRRRDRRRRPAQRDHRGHQGEVLRAAPAVAQEHRQSDSQHGARRQDARRIRWAWSAPSARRSATSTRTCPSPTCGR